MFFDYAATKPWIPLHDGSPVRVDSPDAHDVRVICVRDARDRMTRWFEATKRQPLASSAPAARWRKS